MTEYVILRSTNVQGTIFAVDGEMSANSPETAIRKFAAEMIEPPDDENPEEEREAYTIFAAVPKRSWTVAKAENEMTTVVKVTPL
jgi:hypothetical protein